VYGSVVKEFSSAFYDFSIVVGFISYLLQLKNLEFL